MPIRYAGNDNRITYGKTPIKSIMQGETAVYGEDVFAKQPLFTYSETQDSVTITGLTDLGKTRKNIIIPSEHNGKAVTAISSTAFNNETNITSVVIPDSVTSIALGAFSGCASLESLTVADGNTVYHSAGNCIIETATKTLVVGCKSSAIPDDGSVTNIGERAFWNCNALTLITIPDSVTSIGDHAFDNCTALASIVIPDSVTNIGEYAFRGCTSLTSVTILDGVTSIGGHAFDNCTALTSIVIPDSVTNIGDWAFYEFDGLTSVVIPNGVASIGDHAFQYCGSLTSVTFGGTVEQWKAITKVGWWNEDYPFTEVKCSDGTVPV